MSRDELTPEAAALANLGSGSQELQLISWSTSRELSGTSVPGQSRAAAGFAIGSGELTISEPGTAFVNTSMQPGGEATLVATTDVATQPTKTVVAKMDVARISAPSALSDERVVELRDTIPSAPLTLPPIVASMISNLQFGRGPFDASWVIGKAAAAMGYYPCPPTVPSAILSVPGGGTLVPEVGAWDPAGNSDRDFYTYTDEATGRGFATFSAAAGLHSYWTLAGTIAVGGSVYMTTTVPAYGWTTVNLGEFAHLGATVSFLDAEVRVSTPGGGSPVPIPLALDDARRAQVQLERLSATQIRFRARAAAGAWSSWSTITGTSHPEAFTHSLAESDFAGGGYLGLQVHTDDDPNVWTTPSGRWSRIAGAGSGLDVVTARSADDAWTVAQEVATATLGAITFEAGELVFLNRERLRGIYERGVYLGDIPTMLAAETLVDLPWSISSDGVADRVTVSYQPPVVQQVSNYGLTVWQSDAVVRINPGRTVTITADLDVSVDDLAPWRSILDTSVSTALQSRWAASYQPGGGGAAPPLNALTVTSTLISPTRARIQLTNNDTAPLWTASTDGTRLLTLRANVSVGVGEAVQLALGASAETARRPLDLNLGPWVQSDETASAILYWLQAMTERAMPVLDQPIEVVPDLSLTPGTVRMLRDPVYTGLAQKVIVTGVSLSGSDGELTQTVRFAVLDTLVWDVDWSLLSQSVGDVDALISTALGPTATVEQALKWLAERALG